MKQPRKTRLIMVAACIVAFASMLMLHSCGSDGTFRVTGRIDNFGTGNLRVVYFDKGAIQSVMAPAVDGKFTMTGRLEQPSLVRIYTGNGTIVGRLAAKPGETIDATFDISDPTAVKLAGNNDSERLAKFITENASKIKDGDTKALNAEIDRYVRDNPKRIVSGILVADYFDARGHEAEATELISLLSKDVVNAAALIGLRNMMESLSEPLDSLHIKPFSLFSLSDSLARIDLQACPATLLMFTDAASRKSDSIAAAMTILRIKELKGELQVIDISCDPDTATWHRSLREILPTDSLKNIKARHAPHNYWTPAPYNISGLEELPIASVPWFITTDSTLRALYRGSSISSARASLP